MRAFVVLGAVCLLFVAAVLLIVGGAGRSERGRATGPGPAGAVADAPPAPEGPLPDVAARVRKFARAPESQEEIKRFVRLAVARGPEAVPEILARLRHEPDIQIQTRWNFVEGRLVGFPTLRSAYLAALRSIPGTEARDALLEVLETSASTEEAYFIVSGLVERGDTGFAGAAFDRAEDADPPHADLARDLVAIAARTEPDGAAAEIAVRTPRGEDPTDPEILGHALESLPASLAAPAARALLLDGSVTRKAKERYVRSLCDRGEPEILAGLRETAREGRFERELLITLAYAAAGSRAFYAERIDLERATRAGDTAEAAAIRDRWERRIREIEALVAEALPAAGEGNAPLRESLERRIAEQRGALPR